MRKSVGRVKSSGLLCFLCVLFFIMWIFPRIRGGVISDFNVPECLKTKLPKPYLFDVFGVLYYLSSAFSVYALLLLLRIEDISKRREDLLKSLILTFSSAFLMMFHYPFLSIIPDTTLALTVVTGAFSMSAISLEMTKTNRKLTLQKLLVQIFLSLLLYFSLIYELIA